MAAKPLALRRSRSRRLRTPPNRAPAARSRAHPPRIPPRPGHGDGHGAGGKDGRLFSPTVLGLALGSVGVVFGDIGTSPLYAFQAAMVQAAKDRMTDASILGVVSMALWALFLVVTVKYVLFVMRADNKGEGRGPVLMALAGRALGQRTRLVFASAVVGAALFYGDSIITPAISVLGAFQGFTTCRASPMWPAPSSSPSPPFFILIGLFLIQSRGTANVARLFGPVMVVWFFSIATLGVVHIADSPKIFFALSPHYAVDFLIRHGIVGLLVLGSVFLTVTGAEASMRTWAISVAGRSRPRGCSWCCRRWR